VAKAKETQLAFKSVSYTDPESGAELGTSVLKSTKLNTKYNLWLVTNNKATSMPFFIESATTLLFGFKSVRDEDRASNAVSGHGFLAASEGNTESMMEVLNESIVSSNDTAELAKAALLSE